MVSNGHFDEIATVLLKFLKRDFLCDTVLVTKDRHLRAHGVILAAVSPVFRAAYESCRLRRGGDSFVQLRNFDSETVEIALNYIYTGKLILPSIYTQVGRFDQLLVKLKKLGLDAQKLNGCEKEFRR